MKKVGDRPIDAYLINTLVVLRDSWRANPKDLLVVINDNNFQPFGRSQGHSRTLLVSIPVIDCPRIQTEDVNTGQLKNTIVNRKVSGLMTMFAHPVVAKSCRQHDCWLVILFVICM
jgi:hypothetical protein